MPHPDYWLALMRQIATEARSLSEAAMGQGERRLSCAQCGYVRLTTGSAVQFCPNGCGELDADPEA